MGVLDDKPNWSKGDLRRLGEALVAGRLPPESGPTYDEVMLWHNEIAAEVAAVLYTTDWSACSADNFDITARPKTLDTLIQKLEREKNMSLDAVQDLAGVRIDADVTLDIQTAITHEIAARFGERSRVRDLRSAPHSGYRAVHVWLRLPAGRAEVQVRTRAQSAWANAYERLGDRFGREIRYDGPADNPAAQPLVQAMHEMSAQLARVEEIEVELKVARASVDKIQTARRHVPPIRGRMLLSPKIWRLLPKLRKTERDEQALRRQVQELTDAHQTRKQAYLDQLEDLNRRLDSSGGG